jgi:lipopolysaccharide/colanic/teichoic acid biosynthesis glycosyltransferase
MTKRLMDLVCATVALLLLSPLLVVLAVSLRLAHGSPVLFRQRRPGLHGIPFDMYKFRTMRDTRDIEGKLLPDEQRLTRLGRFLRSTSLDELPEPPNVVLIGSLCGVLFGQRCGA